MGYVEIFRPDGTYEKLEGGLTLQQDVHFVCDLCQKVQPLADSEITSADGIALIQLCYLCKKFEKRAVRED